VLLRTIVRGAPYWGAFLVFVLSVRMGRRVQRYAVNGDSMLPTLRNGDWLIADTGAYAHRPPQPGHVVIVLDPRTGDPLIKRVAWLEDTPGTPATARVFLLGDNARASTDSRTFGPVEPTAIRARVLWRYWPNPLRGRIVTDPVP
jgi:nickel-type superoxide dismutase maturation protease